MIRPLRLFLRSTTTVIALFFLALSLLSTGVLSIGVRPAIAQDTSTDTGSTDTGSTDTGSTDTGSMEEEAPAALPPPLIGDLNGNGSVETDAFGDSLTRGVGDFIFPGEDVEFVGTPAGEAGYPLRIELLLGLPVSNLGEPGERLATQGLVRFAQTQPERRPDVVIISGGTNDAIDQVLTTDYQRSVQTMINIARATGSVPVLAGIPETCCDDSGLNLLINPYNGVLATLAVINDIAFADIQHAYSNTCRGVTPCFLLNQPEGIHPNESGYDVSGEVIVATLLGIDIFAPDGPSLLAQALGVDPASIQTIPDPGTVAPAS